MFTKILMAVGLMGALATSATAQEPFWSNNWKTDFDKTTIDLGEVVDVIGKDNIPAIDTPEFKAAADEDRIPGNEPVVSLAIDGKARAYPLRYLMWHEIVNDTLAGVPVAVTYCPLCNTALVFERTLDGNEVTFGTSGKLRHSDLIMYDRGEENWWQQFNGEAIAGARAGQKLKAIPSSLISFDMYRARFPDGEVLLPAANRASQAGRNPYERYDSAAFPFLFRGELPKDIDAMMRVAFVQEPEPFAVTLPYLQQNAPVRVGDFELTWEAGQASALDSGRISDGRDVGSIEVFKVLENGAKEPVVYTVTFAFAARAFLPELKITQ